MAKAKTNVNKSEEIRKVFEGNPKAGAKDVVALLAEKGVEVNEGLVYQVKRTMNGKKKSTKTKAIATPKATVSIKTKAPPSSNGILSVAASIAAVRACAGRVGGMPALKEIVDALQ